MGAIKRAFGVDSPSLPEPPLDPRTLARVRALVLADLALRIPASIQTQTEHGIASGELAAWVRGERDVAAQLGAPTDEQEVCVAVGTRVELAKQLRELLMDAAKRELAAASGIDAAAPAPLA